MKLGIAIKLGVLLALLAMTAAAMPGLYIYHENRKLLVDSATAKLLTSAQVLSRRIETVIKQEAAHDLGLLANHPAAQATLTKPNTAQDDQLSTLFRLIMAENPNYFQIRLIGADEYGRERVRVVRLKSLIKRVIGDDLRDQGHFSYVPDTLRLSANDVYMSAITINNEQSGYDDAVERPSVQLAMPVMGSGSPGAALGVVVVSIDVNGLFTRLTEDIPKTYRLFFTH